MRKAAPQPLSTGRHRRNVIIASILAAALIIGGIVWFALSRPTGDPLSANVPDSTPVVVKEVQSQVESTDNNPDKAKAVIADYYAALAAKDPVGLRAVGADEAAKAAERGWLDGIGMVVDASKTTPDHDGFPASVGLYAGCSIYRISDFFNSAPEKAVKTDVTGETSVLGWIYYNPMTSSWVIVDPCVPTAISATAAASVERASSDRTVSVKETCPGAFSNAWWCFARIDVEVANSSEKDPAFVVPATFDAGITLDVPGDLQGEVAPAIKTTVTDSGSPVTALEPTRKAGKCTIVRGITSNFNIDRIGAKPQTMDGDISPVRVEYLGENAAPILAIGKATTDSVQSEKAEQQIRDYKATSEPVTLPPADGDRPGEGTQN